MMPSMTSGNKHKFSFGKKFYNIFDYVKIGFLLEIPLDLISSIPGVSKKKVFNAIDVVQQKIGIDALNDYIIKNDELIKYRIERVVSDAVKEHEKHS